MTIQEIQEKIIQETKGLNSWMDKYNYLIKLGKALPPINSEYKTEENFIKDCQAKIWVHSTFKDGKVFYEIDSHSVIMRGVIVLLIKILSGQKLEDIKNADLYFIDKSGLKEICPSSRMDIFLKIVNRMKSNAALYETMPNL
jgi:cysteine desulfuration protein SufE